MNLVQSPWLPFRLQDGTEQVLPMTAICDPNVVDFALPRADFQGAAYQFAIGLLQTVFAPQDKYDWYDLYEQAPDADVLKKAFDKVTHAFNTVGDGPIFMQDLELLDSLKYKSISALLIESPGENTQKENKDHFVKRGNCSLMSLEMAVISLFTLQTYAPEGGQGHLTGLRGGGPLTTLILPQKVNASLWQRLWLNVIDRDFWRYSDPDFSSVDIFPWLSPIRLNNGKAIDLFPADVHPLHVFWAMPRRVRLKIESVDGVCQMTGKASNRVVAEYKTKNYGYNYKGSWLHPLTPIKWNPKKPEDDSWCLKGQQGGFTYKIWDVLALNSNNQAEGQKCAKAISSFHSLVSEFAQAQSASPRLWAFGYDMKTMAAKGWYSSELPLFSVSPEQQEDMLYQVKDIQHLAAVTLKQCRTEITKAWFDDGGSGKKTPKRDMSFIDLAFWQRTETAFYNVVQQLITNSAKNDPYLTTEQADIWLKALRNTAADLFDEYALSELGSERSMAKRIKARQLLTAWLYGGKDIKRFISEHKIEQQKEVV